jgi:hypothetical protein
MAHQVKSFAIHTKHIYEMYIAIPQNETMAQTIFKVIVETMTSKGYSN